MAPAGRALSFQVSQVALSAATAASETGMKDFWTNRESQHVTKIAASKITQ
jgi:hypothetical protein